MKKSNYTYVLVTKGRSSNRENGGKTKCQSKSKTRGRKVVNSFRCYHCRKKGHTTKYCHLKHMFGNTNKPFGSGKRYERSSTSGEIVVVKDIHESSKVLVVLSSVDDCEWILDSNYSFI